MKVSKQTAREWRENIEYQIRKLNAFTGNDLTGENFHELSFGIIVRSGMIAINDYLYDLMKYYHLI